jgi:hypothetical protein
VQTVASRQVFGVFPPFVVSLALHLVGDVGLLWILRRESHPAADIAMERPNIRNDVGGERRPPWRGQPRGRLDGAGRDADGSGLLQEIRTGPGML